MNNDEKSAQKLLEKSSKNRFLGSSLEEVFDKMDDQLSDYIKTENNHEDLKFLRGIL